MGENSTCRVIKAELLPVNDEERSSNDNAMALGLMEHWLWKRLFCVDEIVAHGLPLFLVIEEEWKRECWLFRSVMSLVKLSRFVRGRSKKSRGEREKFLRMITVVGQWCHALDSCEEVMSSDETANYLSFEWNSYESRVYEPVRSSSIRLIIRNSSEIRHFRTSPPQIMKNGGNPAEVIRFMNFLPDCFQRRLRQPRLTGSV